MIEQKKPEEKNVSRRKFIYAGAGVVVVAAAGAAYYLLLPSPTPTPIATATLTATPTMVVTTTETTLAVSPTTQVAVVGGTLLMGEGFGTENLDPAITTLQNSLYLTHQCLSALVRLDGHTLSPGPDFATRWEATPDAKEWTFYLRQGVKFTNGKDAKAEDVKFTYDRVRDMKTASAIFPFLVSCDVVDDYTVKITNSSPYAAMLAACADGKAHIVPKLSDSDLKAIGGDFSNTVIGTGPFMVKDRQLGDHETLVRNPSYYGKDEGGVQLPYLDEIDQRVQTDDTARTMSLQTGVFDFITGVPKSQLANLEKQSDIVLYHEQGRNVYTFSGNPAYPFWQDINFRQACHYAINKQEFVDTILFGHGIVARTWCPPYDPFRYDVMTMEHDASKAKDLLAKSVYKGETYEMKVYKAGVMPDVAVLLQKQFEDVGIHTKITQQELGFYIDDCIRKGNWVVSPEWNTLFADAAIGLEAHLNHKSGTYNWRHIGDAHLDALLDAGSAELDFDKRKAIYHEAQIYIMESSWWIPIVYDPSFSAFNKKVQNLNPTVEGTGWPEYYDAWIQK